MRVQHNSSTGKAAASGPQTYFPQASIHEIDASRPPQELAKEIRKVLGEVK
jgi:hypothetical protein